jgi:succinylglutamate desuccinylase
MQVPTARRGEGSRKKPHSDPARKGFLQTTKSRATTNIAMHTSVSSAEPISAVRRSRARLKVSLMVRLRNWRPYAAINHRAPALDTAALSSNEFEAIAFGYPRVRVV